VRIMTFNIRFENEHDKNNAWQYRRELVAEIIQRHSPSLVGIQEGKSRQLLYLKKHLSGYNVYMPDRVIDDTSQYPTLFCQESGVTVAQGGEFWLSKTPAIHLSKNWDSAFPRMMSYGLCLDQESKKHFLAAVTHLDHKGSEARWQQAKIIYKFIQNHTGPTILMGDFNDRPGSRVHQLLTSTESELRDSWEILGREEDEKSMTHHGFTGMPKKTRMDWILVSKHFRVIDAQIIRDNSEGSYPSDHYPYMVDLEWA
jgi:endonuclease/exonuclease/phosphatase family metal-dependent hydrolase